VDAQRSADLIVYLRVTQLSESAILIIVHDILGIDTAYSMKIGCSMAFIAVRNGEDCAPPSYRTVLSSLV